MTTAYTHLLNRKRTWTPVAVTQGKLKEGGEEVVKRALALRCLEIPVADFITESSFEHDNPPFATYPPACIQHHFITMLRIAGGFNLYSSEGPKASSTSIAGSFKSFGVTSQAQSLVYASLGVPRI